MIQHSALPLTTLKNARTIIFFTCCQVSEADSCESDEGVIDSSQVRPVLDDHENHSRNEDEHHEADGDVDEGEESDDHLGLLLLRVQLQGKGCARIRVE